MVPYLPVAVAVAFTVPCAGTLALTTVRPGPSEPRHLTAPPNTPPPGTANGRRISVSRGVGMERGQAPRVRLGVLPEVSIVSVR